MRIEIGVMKSEDMCMEIGAMGNQWILKALVLFLSMEGLVRERGGDVLSMIFTVEGFSLSTMSYPSQNESMHSIRIQRTPNPSRIPIK